LSACIYGIAQFKRFPSRGDSLKRLVTRSETVPWDRAWQSPQSRHVLKSGYRHCCDNRLIRTDSSLWKLKNNVDTNYYLWSVFVFLLARTFRSCRETFRNSTLRFTRGSRCSTNATKRTRFTTRYYFTYVFAFRLRAKRWMYAIPCFCCCCCCCCRRPWTLCRGSVRMARVDVPVANRTHSGYFTRHVFRFFPVVVHCAPSETTQRLPTHSFGTSTIRIFFNSSKRDWTPVIFYNIDQIHWPCETTSVVFRMRCNCFQTRNIHTAVKSPPERDTRSTRNPKHPPLVIFSNVDLVLYTYNNESVTRSPPANTPLNQYQPLYVIRITCAFHSPSTPNYTHVIRTYPFMICIYVCVRVVLKIDSWTMHAKREKKKISQPPAIRKCIEFIRFRICFGWDRLRDCILISRTSRKK